MKQKTQLESEDEILTLTEEEIQKLSKILADTLIQSFFSEENPEQEITAYVVVEGCQIIREDEVTTLLRLDLIASETAGVLDPIGELGDWIADLFNSVASWIVASFETFIETVISPMISAIDSFIRDVVYPAISGVVDTVLSIVDTIVSSIGDLINSAITTITGAVDSAITAISGAIDAIASSILSTIETVQEALSGAISGVIDTISSIITTVQETIIGTINGIIDFINTGITTIIDTISGVISGVVETLSDIFTSIANTIIDTISTIIETITQAITATATTIVDSITGAVSGLWEWLVESFENILANVSAGFEAITRGFTGFINAILKFPEWLWNFIGRPIWEAIVGLGQWIWDSLSAIADPIIGFFGWITEIVGQLIADPIGWLNTYVVQPILGALEWLWNALQTLWNWIVGAIQTVLGWLWEGLLALGKGLIDLLSEGIKGVWEALSSTGEVLTKALSEIVTGFFDFMGKEMKGIVEGITNRVIKGKSQGEIAEIFLLFGGLVSTQFTFRMISQALMWIGEQTDGWKILPNVAIKILGAGGETTIEIPLKFGAVLKHLAKEFKGYADELMRGFFYGIAIWYTAPIVKMINSLMRNTIPIEIPTPQFLVEATRRSLPHKMYENVIKQTYYFMSLFGYSDFVIDLYFKKAKEYNIKVKDRFGKQRLIPLSMMYKLPSSSDVATMMVRDIFASIEDFQKIYLATGMEKDVGALYYFLRYRYPPPETLWKFTTRGISGLLWATLPDEEKTAIEKEAKPLGAYIPIAPKALNKMDKNTITKLLESFKTYMKWHDFARFSWIKNFPSDNLIHIDTLADIPTKIDQRWMLKWGIYEHLSSKQVTYKSPISDFTLKVVENSPVGNIKLDLTNFCRTMQATGLHPWYVPTVAVSEALNALSEERTYMRTGFVNLFKEGFWDTKAIEKLLAGFVISSFKVSYFDITQLEWKTGWINIPVMYLPPERKLIELRALMDRALDILREIQRDISKGYTEWIIENYEEYKKKLTGVIKNINEFFAKDYQSITGKALPKELMLEFVEAYYKPYVKALDIWREVFVYRRTRYWTQRWLGWVMYRLAYGAITTEDIQKLVTVIKDYTKITPKEIEFISQIAQILYGIAQREYSPTPSQLATFAEYMVITDEHISKVFEARKIPEQWQELWRTYINVRPIADDIKSLLSTYRRALIYATIPEEIKKAVEEYAKIINFTEREWNILALRVQLEELIIEARESKREYIPTPLSLATLTEYLPEARKFFKDVMEAKRVPKEWQSLWAKYIDIKPLIDDIKKYLRRAESLYTRFMMKEEDFKKFVEAVSEKLGYTKEEVQFLMETAELELYRYAWTEVIGDVDRMMSLSEYSPRAREFALGTINKMIDKLPIDDNTKQILKELWEQYIRVRPIHDEVKRYVTELINDFVEGIITEEEFKNELEALKKWGLDDYEIMFYQAIAGLKKARYLKRRAMGR